MLLSTGASGFLGKLLGAGAQRIGSLVFQKIMRTQKIDFSLKGNQLKNPIIKSAIADFETVIGSYYGRLDEKTHAFLEELEKTGLINHVVECALFERNSAVVEQLFFDLHGKFFEQHEGDPRALFDSLKKSMSISIKELSKDRALLEFVDATHRDISERLDHIDASLSVLAANSNDRVKTFEQLKPTLIKIARGLQSSYKTVRIETTKGARQVEITKIYIPPKLKYRENSSNAYRIESAIKGAFHQKKLKIHSVVLDENGELYEPGPNDLTKFEYKEFKGRFRRAVVLGDPGGGKSTLCQYLCFDLAKQASLALQAGIGRDTAAQTQKVPIRVILRLYERARSTNSQLTIFEFIIKDLMNHVNSDAGEIVSAVKYLLETGRAVLAFDGLDEILSTAHRREFVDLVSAFCNQYPLCPVLVTSRLVGYDNACLSDEYEELVLEKFDIPEINNYVKKFMMVVGGRKESEAEALSSNFISQTNSNAADIRRNPLMLGLMAWLFEMRRDVPSNRPEIYQECAVLMFERWDPDRDIRPDAPTDFDRLQLFTEIASKLFDTEESAGVDTAWLEKSIRDFLDKIYENRAFSIAASKKLVKFITGRAWVMSEVGDGTFAFTHQTFLEYFFARHVDAESDSIEEVFDKIQPRIANREWDVVAHLSLQIKTYRNLRRMDAALIKLLNISRNYSDKSERTALISFSARALEYLSGSEVNVRSVVEHVYEQAVQDGAEGNFERFRDVVQCTSCAVERRKFVMECLTDLFCNSYMKQDLPVMRAVNRLVTMSQEPSARRHNANTVLLPMDLSRAIRDKLRSFIIENAAKHEMHAISAVEWYGYITDKLVTKYGLEMYDRAVLPPFYENSLFSFVVASLRRTMGGLEPEQAINGLKAIGQGGVRILPIPRSQQFAFVHFGIPISVWKSAIEKFSDDYLVVSGVLIAMLISSQTFNRESSQEIGPVKLDYIPVAYLTILRHTIENFPRGFEKSAFDRILQSRSIFE